jgi:hypothetical protein
MIAEGLRDSSVRLKAEATLGPAERLARMARSAGSDQEAVEAVRKALEELLS